jgi:hypothetical protein
MPKSLMLGGSVIALFTAVSLHSTAAGAQTRTDVPALTDQATAQATAQAGAQPGGGLRDDAVEVEEVVVTGPASARRRRMAPT